jgi:TM2 domain-containing membrane protein YozV
MTNPGLFPGAGGDARSLMLFEANKKSTGVAYLLWFFLGGLGGHRFYAGKTGSAIAILLLTIGGLVLTFVGVGVVMLIAAGIWVLVDAFLIPGWIRNRNNLLAVQLGGR